MFRHTALFLLLPETTSEQREQMLRGLASLPGTCETVRSQDFGENALPGAGIAGAYDVALHLDFDDAEGYATYFADPGHSEVAAFNASITVADRTARVDWAPQAAAPGKARHTAMFVWADGRSDDGLEAAAALAAAPGVTSALVAENAGTDARAWDWVLDLTLDDLPAAKAFLGGEPYLNTMSALAPAVVAGKTAHVTCLTRR